MPRFQLSDGSELFYADDGEGRPLVFVHGGFMSHRVWDLQVLAFNDDYRVVRMDLLGHGRSDKPDISYTAERYADDIHELLAGLGLNDVTLVGWSLGATITATYMSRHGERVRDVVLVCSGLFRWLFVDPNSTTSSHDIETMLSAIREDHPKMMWEFVEGLFATDVSQATTEWVWQITMQQPLHIAYNVLSIYADADFQKLQRIVEAIVAPAIVFQGSKDTAATLDQAERVADEFLLNGSFEPFDSSGHAPFIEERTHFNQALREFIET